MPRFRSLSYGQSFGSRYASILNDKKTVTPPKIRERLARLYPDIQRPAISTVHAVLDRHGLVTRRRRRRNRAMGTPLSSSRNPNALSGGAQRAEATSTARGMPAGRQAAGAARCVKAQSYVRSRRGCAR